MGRQTPQSVTNPDAKREEIYRRRMKAAELRRKGHTWAEIAAANGQPQPARAFDDVHALLKEHQSLAYDEIGLYRQESLDRLTDLLKVAMKGALQGDDKMMREARLLISAIGDLTGEKAPVRVEIGESDVDRAIREISDELNRRFEAHPGQASGVQAPSG